MSGIIWLASYPKSGNTWLRAFLANYLSNAKTAVPINELPNFILGDNLILHYEQFTSRAIDDFSPQELAALRPKVHQWFAQSRPEEVFVKTHNAICNVDGVPLITPAATAGALYAVRNPLDIAVSFAHHYQIDYDRAVTALCDDDYALPASSGLLAQYLGSWSRHVASWSAAPGLTLLVLRYEDMKQKPAKAFGRLVKFLGLPADQDRLRRAIKFSSFPELAKQEKSTAFVESRPDGKTKFFRSGQVGSWRQALSAAQVERLVEHHRDTMVQLGYLSQDGRLKV